MYVLGNGRRCLGVFRGHNFDFGQVRPFRNRFRCCHGAAYFGGAGVCVGYGCRGWFGPYYRSDTPRSWLFLALSGLATGGSWICYFKALSLGDVNKVVPVDKSSTVMAVLLAIVLFGETSHLEVKLVGTAVIAVGTLMMIEKKQGASGEQSRAWLVYALLAAVFAALTSVLAKVGIEGVESNLATAIRTCFVLVMAWVIVAGRGKLSQVRHVDVRELGFLVASGVATGASWLFFYYAISAGQVSVVVQIDKLSILISIAFAWIVFGERLTPKSGTGLALIVAGTLAMSIWI